MNANAALVRHARDTRLYLFLGLANWFIFLDHIPNNMVSWITLRNFGFSGAVDLFVFIIGYNAALTYAPIMLERGTIVGATPDELVALLQPLVGKFGAVHVEHATNRLLLHDWFRNLELEENLVRALDHSGPVVCACLPH